MVSVPDVRAGSYRLPVSSSFVRGVSVKKHSTIKQRLALLVVAPLILLIILASILITDSYVDYRNAANTQTMLKLAVTSGNVIHALQIERGSTTGFIQSRGARFGDVLPGIQKKTDEQVGAFLLEVGRLNQSSLPSLSGALAGTCTEFCVNGLLAGNCRIVWRHNEREETCSS